MVPVPLHEKLLEDQARLLPATGKIRRLTIPEFVRIFWASIGSFLKSLIQWFRVLGIFWGFCGFHRVLHGVTRVLEKFLLLMLLLHQALIFCFIEHIGNFKPYGCNEFRALGFEGLGVAGPCCLVSIVVGFGIVGFKDPWCRSTE